MRSPKDNEDPTAKEGADEDDPEDSLLDQELKRILQVFFRIEPGKHHEVYRALQASGIASLRQLLEADIESIDTLRRQGKKGDNGPILALTKSKLRKIFSLARALDDSGQDPPFDIFQTS